jgi:hypothetical protein
MKIEIKIGGGPEIFTINVGDKTYSNNPPLLFFTTRWLSFHKDHVGYVQIKSTMSYRKFIKYCNMFYKEFK